MRRIYHDTLRWVIRLLLGPVVIAVLGNSPASACGSDTPCLQLDSLWLSSGSWTAMQTLERRDSRWRVGFMSSYHREPLVARLPSPDPFGTEASLVEDWWTLQVAAGLAVTRALELGVVLAGDWRSSGTGIAALSQSAPAKRGRPTLSDPRLVVRWGCLAGKAWQLDMAQQVTLPLAGAGSLGGARGIGYAPTLTLSSSRKWFRWAVEAGVRLRPMERVGVHSFGSEGWFAAGGSLGLVGAWRTALEVWAAPSLVGDEWEAGGVRSEWRRVASEWLATLSHDSRHGLWKLGVGTALPLTRQQTHRGGPTSTELFVGPPGPRVRVALSAQLDLL